MREESSLGGMSVHRSIRRQFAGGRAGLGAIAVAVAVVLAGCTASPAGSGPSDSSAGTVPPSTSATAPSSAAPVSVDEIAQGDQTDPVQIAVPGPVQVNYREITLQPGASTGKHCHYGNLIAVVKQGVLTHYAPTHPGGVAAYAAGESIIEGAGYVHEGRNEGTENVILWVTYLTPEGDPLAQTDLTKCAG